MTSIRGLSGLLACGIVMSLLSGCGPTISDDVGILPTPLPPGGSQTSWVEPPTGTGWTDTDDPLPDTGKFIPTTERWAGVVVYFAYDSAAIGLAERPKLETLSKHLKDYRDYCVVIEGHCDDRGSDEYNRALGETRAHKVRDYLIDLGIDGSRIETLSYGEERLVVTGATAESDHQKNRRAEFIIGTRQ